MKRIVPLMLLIQLTAGIAPARNEAPKHTLRILPLGDPPPFRQQVRDGARYEIAAPEGTVPPRTVLLGAALPDGPAPLPLRLRLGLASAPVTFPAAPGTRVSLTTGDGAAWTEVRLGTSAATLALVCRGGKLWNSARVLAIADDAREGDFRFVNMTGKPMAVTWGDEKLRLDPGKTFLRRLPEGTSTLPLSIHYPGPDGNLRPCLTTEAERVRGSSHLYVIYAADGEKPQIPVKVLPWIERVETGNSEVLALGH